MSCIENSVKNALFMSVDLSVDDQAKHLAELYRRGEKFRLSKADRLKDVKETKSLIDRLRKAKAVLLECQPGPYEIRAALELEDQIAHLKTLLPKGGGRPIHWAMLWFIWLLS